MLKKYHKKKKMCEEIEKKGLEKVIEKENI